MIGIGSAGSVQLLEREASIPRTAGVRYGIGLLAWAIERDPELLDCALTAGPDLIAVSFGAPEGWPERVRDAGITTATHIASPMTPTYHRHPTPCVPLRADETQKIRLS